MDKNQQVGITESGEIAFHLEAFNNLRRANIIITKRLTNQLIEKLIEHKDKCILHLTVTGMGGTKVEPFVPTYKETFNKFGELIEKGFPIEQVVLRVDPIIPTPKGVKTALEVIKLFINNYNIPRIRWSSLDMYEHVKERFKENKIPLDITLEACGESGYKTPCVSQKDLDILRIKDIELIGSAEQRKHCSCPSNKVEILGIKPERCNNKCLYCYWKD